MNVEEKAIPTRVYTRADGLVAIEQSSDSLVLLTAEQVRTVIEELHVCYDYCATWKNAAPE